MTKNNKNKNTLFHVISNNCIVIMIIIMFFFLNLGVNNQQKVEKKPKRNQNYIIQQCRDL